MTTSGRIRKLATRAIMCAIAATLAVGCSQAISRTAHGTTEVGRSAGIPARTPLAHLLGAGEWADVERLLVAVTPQSPSAPERFAKGHALLRRNRPTEATDLFLSASALFGLSAWDDWTATFLIGRERNLVARYLRGDALARLGRHDEALAEFDRALALRADDALVLNARATVRATMGAWDDALEDAGAAIKHAPTFADARATFGGMLVLQRDADPEVAAAAFDDALRLASGFALAHNGRACASFASGQLEETVASLERSRQLAGWMPVAVGNLVSVASLRDRLLVDVETTQGRIRPGTPLQTISRYTNALGRQDARAARVVTSRNLNTSRQLNQVGRTLASYGSASKDDDGVEELRRLLIQKASEKLNDLETLLAACIAKGDDCDWIRDWIKRLREELAEYIAGGGDTESDASRTVEDAAVRRRLQDLVTPLPDPPPRAGVERGPVPRSGPVVERNPLPRSGDVVERDPLPRSPVVERDPLPRSEPLVERDPLPQGPVPGGNPVGAPEPGIAMSKTGGRGGPQGGSREPPPPRGGGTRPPGQGNPGPPVTPPFPWPERGPVWGPLPGPIPPDPTGPGGQGLPPGPDIPQPDLRRVEEIQALGRETVAFSERSLRHWGNVDQRLEARMETLPSSIVGEPGGISFAGTAATYWDQGLGLSTTYSLLYPFRSTTATFASEGK